jgi:hypothetical protein
MPLSLRSVPAASGVRWVRDAFGLFRRRPLTLMLMFGVFLSGVTALALLPWMLGLPLLLAAPPLLSLGFMIASQSVLLDGPVHPRQFIEPFRTDPRRRGALIQLCLLYAAAMAAIAALCLMIGGEPAQKLLDALLAGPEATATAEDLMTLMAEPALTTAISVGDLLIALVSLPFWHAPALVHWGAQSAGQALFSSTLAVWRCKGAFMMYGLAWAAISMFVALAASLLLALFGNGPIGLALAFTLLLASWTVFYVSLLFTFNDSFGGSTIAAGDAPGSLPPA